jgi:hypothetical protein
VSTKKTSSSSSRPLACPSCALRYELDERFCARCGMPLVYVGSEPIEVPVNDAHDRARKINPAYTEGELVRVAGGRNQAEAELIQGLLLEEGVPSVLRRSPGFDVPDFLAAGPRDVMVPESGAEPAREVLLEAELAPPEPGEGSAPPNLGRLVAAIAGGGAITALIAWLLSGAAG